MVQNRHLLWMRMYACNLVGHFADSVCKGWSTQGYLTERVRISAAWKIWSLERPTLQKPYKRFFFIPFCVSNPLPYIGRNICPLDSADSREDWTRTHFKKIPRYFQKELYSYWIYMPNWSIQIQLVSFGRQKWTLEWPQNNFMHARCTSDSRAL